MFRPVHHCLKCGQHVYNYNLGGRDDNGYTCITCIDHMNQPEYKPTKREENAMHIGEIISQIREDLNLKQEEEFETLPKIREDKHPLEGWCPICLGSTRPLDELRFLCPRCWNERGRYQPLTNG